MVTVSFNSCVRGHHVHVFKSIRTPFLEEQLSCQREHGNNEDLYAVAMIKAGVIVGHVLQKISMLCSVFIRQGGTVSCVITGNRCYSDDYHSILHLVYTRCQFINNRPAPLEFN